MARLTQNEVVNGLVARGVPQHVAIGVAMNFRDESGFNTSINEATPNAHGTNGRVGSYSSNLRTTISATCPTTSSASLKRMAPGVGYGLPM